MIYFSLYLICMKQKPSQMNVPVKREKYVARSSPVRPRQTSSISKRKIQSCWRADTGCSPLSRIMTRIRNLAHLPSPNGSGTILRTLPQLWLTGKASPGQIRIIRCELFWPWSNCSQKWTCRLWWKQANGWAGEPLHHSIHKTSVTRLMSYTRWTCGSWSKIMEVISLDSLCFLFLFHPLFLSKTIHVSLCLPCLKLKFFYILQFSNCTGSSTSTC